MRAPRTLLVPALIATLLAVGGCGRATPPKPHAGSTPSVNSADRACQDQFARLGQSIGATPRKGYAVPVAFASRWASIQNGLDYYSTDATTKDCQEVLPSTTHQVQQLTALTASLAPYDVQARALSTQGHLAAWASAHAKRRTLVTQMRQVSRAVVRLAPKAAADINPALVQLAGIDPANAAAVKKAMKDLNLLANTSTAFAECRQGLAFMAKNGLKS